MKKLTTTEEKLAEAELEIQRLTSALYETNKELAVIRPKYNAALDKNLGDKKRLDVLEAKDKVSEQRYADVIDSFTFVIFGLLKLSPGALPQEDGDGAEADRMTFTGIQTFLQQLISNDAPDESVPNNEQHQEQESA